MRSWIGALVVALFASTVAWAQEEGEGEEQQPAEVEPGSAAQGARNQGAPEPQAEGLDAAEQAQPAPKAQRRPPILADDTPVKLPWSEVAKLLEQARKARPDRAPIPFALGPARIEGEADAHTLVVRIEVPVQLSDDGWTAVPLWRSTAAVRRATFDGRPAPAALERGAVVLLVRGHGPHTLRAELVTTLSGGGDQVKLGFATPVAASWRLRLPGKAARIEPAVHQAFHAERSGVVLEATTAPAETLSIDWTGARAGAAPSRVSVESFTYVVFREDTTSGRSTFEFQVTGGGRDTLGIGIPAAMELLSAEAKDLAHWAVEGSGAEKRLVASFVRAQRGRVSLRLGFELPKPAETAELPVLVARDVDEQRAWLAASAESPVSITQESMQGGEAVDVKHLPAHLLSGVTMPFTLAWRHAGKDFTGQVRIARHATVSLPQATIDAAYYTTVLTEEGQEVVKATFLVKNNLKPYLAVTLPPGSQLSAAFVSGESVNPSLLAGGPGEARPPSPPLARDSEPAAKPRSALGPAGGQGQAHPPGPALAAEEGSVVLLPLVKSREVGTGENLAVHQIEAGWSLSDLALTYYHDASKWKQIAAANAALFGENQEAQVGQSVVIPRLAPGPGVSDLETAFPVEIVYSRENRAPGLAGSVDLEVPATDLGVMSAVWTVYLPSRIDPLCFSGNLTQTSSVRYGLFRRLRYLFQRPFQSLTSPWLGSQAQAGGKASLRERFSFGEEGEEDLAARSHPRVSLPLVGRGYVFKRYLLEGEQPSLSAVYLDRRTEPPVRWAALGLGFALALWSLGVWQRRPSTRAALFAAAVFVTGTLGLGHFVLGTHRRAVAGVVLGLWLALAIALRRLPPAGAKPARAWQRVVCWGNFAVLVLVALAGLNWITFTLGLAFVVLGLIRLWRSRGRSGTGPAAAGAALAAILLLLLPAGGSAADLPPGAEVTVPFSQLKGLVGDEARPLPPPRPFTTLSADYRASLQGERLAVEGKIAVEVHSDQWVAVPLVSRAHALSRLQVDGRPASAAVLDGRYRLPLRGAGTHTVELSFLVKTDPGMAQLDLVPGVAGTLTAQLPAAGMEPEITPATEVRVDGAVLHALLPADGRTELYWSPRGEAREAAALPSEVRTVARTLQIISPEEQRIRVFAAVRYLVQRGTQSHFAVQLPDGVELLDVQGEGIAEHEVVAEGGKNVLRVTTESLVREEFELSFAYDWKPPKDGGMLPVFQVLDVRSETGTLGIESAGNLELKLVKVDGAAAIDVRNAPELLEHTDKPILHAVRYLQHPYGVQVAFERHPEKEIDTATVDRATYTTVLAGDGRAMTRGVLRMRNARQSFLGIDLPAAKGLESELQSVIIGGAPAKPVRDAKGRLLLPLMRSPSAEREMRAFEVEVVYLTRIAELPRSGAVPALLPSIDLGISKVEWSLYLPPGVRATSRRETEEAEDYMQWATAPRALWARPTAPRSEGDSVASGGIFPVRFNLPEHGTAETFWRHYLPAGTQPTFQVSYAPRSTRAAVQVALVIVVLGLGVSSVWFWRRRKPIA